MCALSTKIPSVLSKAVMDHLRGGEHARAAWLCPWSRCIIMYLTRPSFCFFPPCVRAPGRPSERKYNGEKKAIKDMAANIERRWRLLVEAKKDGEDGTQGGSRHLIPLKEYLLSFFPHFFPLFPVAGE